MKDRPGYFHTRPDEAHLQGYLFLPRSRLWVPPCKVKHSTVSGTMLGMGETDAEIPELGLHS